MLALAHTLIFTDCNTKQQQQMVGILQNLGLRKQFVTTKSCHQVQGHLVAMIVTRQCQGPGITTVVFYIDI